MRLFPRSLCGVVSVAVMLSALPSATGQARAASSGNSLTPGCMVRVPQITGDFPTLLYARLPDGALLFGSSSVERAASVTVLRAVLPNCRPDMSFGTGGRATLKAAVPPGSGAIGALYVTAKGYILLGGGAGKDILVGELLPDGAQDHAFGEDGWDRLYIPVPSAAGMPTGLGVTSIVQGPGGSIYLAGNNGAAHCCVEDFVAAVTPSGRPQPSFGGHGWVNIQGLGGSYSSSLFMTHDGLLDMGFVMYTGCGGPVLARIDWDGRLDKSFSLAADQAADGVKPGYVLVGPSLYPLGTGFGLVSDLMPSGCRVHMPKPVSTAVALAFTAAGHLDRSFGTGGRTFFAAAGSSQTWAVPGPGGSTFVVVEQLPPTPQFGPPQGLVVRELSTSGHFLPSYGRGGQVTLNLRWAWGAQLYAAIGALAGPGGAATVLVAAKQEVALYQLAGLPAQ